MKTPEQKRRDAEYQARKRAARKLAIATRYEPAAKAKAADEPKAARQPKTPRVAKARASGQSGARVAYVAVRSAKAPTAPALQAIMGALPYDGGIGMPAILAALPAMPQATVRKGLQMLRAAGAARSVGLA